MKKSNHTPETMETAANPEKAKPDTCQNPVTYMKAEKEVVFQLFRTKVELSINERKWIIIHYHAPKPGNGTKAGNEKTR